MRGLSDAFTLLIIFGGIYFTVWAIKLEEWSTGAVSATIAIGGIMALLWIRKNGSE